MHARTVAYGEDASQVADLFLPPTDGPHPTVVLVHGGFWRSMYDRSLMVPLAHDLVSHGYAVWNIEYRRIGQSGGGWPGTFLDAAAAVDALSNEPDVDTTRIVACGHSAGGHLALWIAARSRVRDDQPGAGPTVAVVAAVSLAGVANLAAAWRARLGADAVDEFMGGGPDDLAGRYATADPAALLPFGVAQLLVHGERDTAVPVSQSTDHAARAARAGDDVEVVTLRRTDHLDVIDPGHRSWAEVTTRLTGLFGATRRE